MSADKSAARLGSEGGGSKVNQRWKHTTQGGRDARAHKRLTPEQRGRFWVSVGEAIEAARAGKGAP